MKSWEDNVRKVIPYTPGEQPNFPDMIKLNTNENPYPPAPGVQRVLDSFGSASGEAGCSNVAIGTHGTALSTVVNYFDPTFGYGDFQRIVDLMPWIVELEFENDRCVGVKEYDLFRKTCLERL